MARRCEDFVNKGVFGFDDKRSTLLGCVTAASARLPEEDGLPLDFLDGIDPTRQWYA